MADDPYGSEPQQTLMLFGRRLVDEEWTQPDLLLSTRFLGLGIQHPHRFDVEIEVTGVLILDEEGRQIVNTAWHGPGRVPLGEELVFSYGGDPPPGAELVAPPLPWPPPGPGPGAGGKLLPSDPRHWVNQLPRNFAGIPMFPSTPKFERGLDAMRRGDNSVAGIMIPNVWQYFDHYARFGIDMAQVVLVPGDPISIAVIEIAKWIWKALYGGAFTATLFGHGDPQQYATLVFFIALLSSWFARESEDRSD
jgi:hypothetical protein